MKAMDLKRGMKVKYEDDFESCQAEVVHIGHTKQSIRFRDWDNFEWDEKFEDIPAVVKQILI